MNKKPLDNEKSHIYTFRVVIYNIFDVKIAKIVVMMLFDNNGK